jgi:hypothetical protein
MNNIVTRLDSNGRQQFLANNYGAGFFPGWMLLAYWTYDRDSSRVARFSERLMSECVSSKIPGSSILSV